MCSMVIGLVGFDNRIVFIHEMSIYSVHHSGCMNQAMMRQITNEPNMKLTNMDKNRHDASVGLV